MTTTGSGCGRRAWLQGAAGLALVRGGLPGEALAQPAGPAASTAAAAAPAAELLQDIERRTFDWFWDTTPHETGLTPDRWPSPGPCSVASVGFALTAYVVGMKQGWVTRAQAAERTRNTLRFFLSQPQGPARMGTIGYKGLFYHFLHPRTGLRASPEVELSTVDTALFMLGALHARQAFDGNEGLEPQVRNLADELYARADWRWSMGTGAGIAMAWHPGRGFSKASWNGYDEGLFIYLLALGSPTYPVPASAYGEFTRTYETKSRFGAHQGQTYLQFGPQFGHQYAQCWIDLRGLQDAYMRSKGLDYFENSRRATLAQRQYAISNPGGWADYGADIWGLTACDGPGPITRVVKGRRRRFHPYTARGIASDAWSVDDGTLAPTAVAASLPFAPEIVVPALQALQARYGQHLYRRYGFVDAFNPTVDFDARFVGGRHVPGMGWFDDDYIGIDQGPIVAMLANHRDETVWAALRQAPWLQRGLRSAGFRGGWLG